MLVTETKPALDPRTGHVFLLCPWLPGYSAPNLIPRQAKCRLESRDREREHPQPLPRQHLTGAREISPLNCPPRKPPSGVSPLATLPAHDPKLILHQVRAPKATELEPLPITGPLPFMLPHLGAQSCTFRKASVADGSMAVMPVSSV